MGHVWANKNTRKILVGKPEGEIERELELSRRRWDDNIETGVNEIT